MSAQISSVIANVLSNNQLQSGLERGDTSNGPSRNESNESYSCSGAFEAFKQCLSIVEDVGKNVHWQIPWLLFYQSMFFKAVPASCRSNSTLEFIKWECSVSRLWFSLPEKTALNFGNQQQQKLLWHPFSIFINLFPSYYSPSCGSWNVWPESHWPSFQTCRGLRSKTKRYGEPYLCQANGEKQLWWNICTRVFWLKLGFPWNMPLWHVGWSMTLHTKGRFDAGTRSASCHQKQQFSHLILLVWTEFL